MITFEFSCEEGHRFEGWFRNREAMEEQVSGGMVACPVCGSQRVDRCPSRLAVHVPRRSASSGPAPNARKAASPQAFFQALAEFVETHFEDVGPSFAEVARKIDAGEEDTRNIRGTTTQAEEEALREDGIEFLKVVLPKHDA
jgi:hypothetical protein